MLVSTILPRALLPGGARHVRAGPVAVAYRKEVVVAVVRDLDRRVAAFIGTTVGFPPLAIHSEIAECRRSWDRNGARRLATAAGRKSLRRNWYARGSSARGEVNTKSSGPTLNGSMWSSSGSTAGLRRERLPD
jgi:hypothetical protein